MKPQRPQDPAIVAELAALDWILRRLVRLSVVYPERALDLAWRIDGALDERLRLMRLRDLDQRLSTWQPHRAALLAPRQHHQPANN